MIEYVTMSPENFVQEPARRVPVRFEGDVVVLGGGSAGIAAAVAAARQGAKVLVVERQGYFGGVMTAASLGTICGLYGVGADDQPIQLVAGIAEEVVQRLRKIDGAAVPKRWIGAVTVPYDLFSLKIVFDEMVAGAGVSIAFHAQAVDVVQADGVVQAVLIEDKSGRWAAKAKAFIDCTGDADLVAQAGGAFELDLESLQLPTTTFRLGSVADDKSRKVTREELRERLETAIRDGASLPRTCGGVYFHKPSMSHLNVTRVKKDGRAPNPFDTFELAQAELEGRRQVVAYQRAFSRYVPGYDQAYVIDSSAHIGYRESRRIDGDFRLELDHVYAGARFDDGIASCSWPVEVHERGGTNTRWDWLPDGVYYQVPLRCLLPRGLANVLVAGRCISTSHDAHGSVRVSATCMAMGEAAGITAALAARAGKAVRAVEFGEIRTALLAKGAVLDARSFSAATN
jgi:hypothetical protein